jgi:hypothetical protein
VLTGRDKGKRLSKKLRLKVMLEICRRRHDVLE